MYFIRHGQSAFNAHMDVYGRDPGIHDAPLTTKGLTQARAAASQLVGQGLTQILSSPYTRALQTAEVIADALKLNITVEPLVAEKQLYSCDVGSPMSALKPRWPKLDFGTLVHEHWWLPPNLLRTSDDLDLLHRDRESDWHFRQRIKSFKEKWGVHDQRHNILIVSHWYFIHAVTGQSLENAEVFRHA